ncbi:methyl-accepting chemotaxis protein [Paenibacillus chartarius]|uniref:Methyl-accepting chemotaxis protein n=1 Tax=Paenibacillus chartarius TaxID=747481 RepID=A0ABV6DRV9_9BACL
MIRLMRTSEYKRLEGDLAKMAEGDFCMQSTGVPIQERSRIRSVIKRTVRSLVSLIRVVDRSSRELHIKMEDTSAKSAMISEQIEGVTGTIREVAVSMQGAAEHVADISEEMNSSYRYLQEVKKKNGELVASSASLSEEVSSGKKEISAAMEQMRVISGESGQVHERMNRLGEAIKKIADMTLLIEEISSQTQLLALNANIEAARAGEHGRGFAVVAQEITRLAAQTKQETTGIRESIRTVTRCSDVLGDSIIHMHAALGTTESTLKTAADKYGKVESFLVHIIGEMNEVDERLEGIASSTLSTTDSVNRTSAMLQQIAAGSEEVLALAELQQQNLLVINDNIQESARRSLSLRSSVSQFRLPSRQESHPMQEELERWVECAMAIRAVMVSMIESRDIEQIREWHRKKQYYEARLETCFQDIRAKAATNEDRHQLDQLSKAWLHFAEIKDRNAAWMLEGEYESAKQALITKGRTNFKRAMDLATEWMDRG